jgi:putative addiction module killer protein
LGTIALGVVSRRGYPLAIHAMQQEGYRIYLGRDGEALIILLGGGAKQRQDRDIARAKACWDDYRTRKAQE